MIPTILTFLGKICLVSVGFTLTLLTLFACAIVIKYAYKEYRNDE